MRGKHPDFFSHENLDLSRHVESLLAHASMP
jgi:hypothetical protein